jgi:hypothetical protein
VRNVPVYGFPILNKVNMMRTMLATFDHDVDRLFVVDNGGIVKPDDVAHFRADNVHIADPGFNMGVGGSWNFIMRANINADWWLLGCVDMNIEPGTVAKVVEDMERNYGRPHMARVVMGNESSWGNHFGLFALNPEAIDMLGWFDENIYPIYFEDNDYMQRMSRAREYGFTDTLIQSTTQHSGNASWNDVPKNAVGNQRTWGINGPYYDSKWADTNGLFRYPFNLDEDGAGKLDGIRYWPQPAVRRIREQDWRVDRRDNVKNDGIIG